MIWEKDGQTLLQPIRYRGYEIDCVHGQWSIQSGDDFMLLTLEGGDMLESAKQEIDKLEEAKHENP